MFWVIVVIGLVLPLNAGAIGDLLVSQSSFPSPVVSRFDGDTGAPLGVFAEGGLTAATGITFGPDGNLYVGTQVSASSVNRYAAVTGEFIEVFADSVDARGITFGPDGNLYVSDASLDAVQRFDGATGAFIDFFVGSSG